MTDVKNFIPSYPPSDDKELIIKLSHLEEFSELQLGSDEAVPLLKGTPLMHQELQARYFSINTPYDKGILWHEVGTGKTCAASLIIERFKKSLVDGKPRKPALVIVRNAALRDSLRYEISKICTRDIYLPKLTENELKRLEIDSVVEMTDEAKIRRLNDAISKTYEIVKYGDILDIKSKSSKGMPSDETIVRDYSNRVIIVDEIQNIRLQHEPTNKPKKVTKPKSDAIKAKKERGRYQNLHKFLHLVKNCRILLLTGTPGWDKVYDIAGIFNLILPLNNQFPTLQKFIKEYFNEDGDILPEKVDDFTEKVRGKVSYIRAMISSAKREEIGVTKPWLKHIIVYPSAMSDYQAGFVREALKKLEENKEGPIYSDVRDAANCIYPDLDKSNKSTSGVYGTDAFAKYAITEKIRKTYEKGKKEATIVVTKSIGFSNVDVYKKLLGPAEDPDIYANLRKYSAKFATIIEMLRDPNRNKEKVFIYNDSVKGTGGIISLALIMKLWGFKWLKRPENAKYSEDSTDGFFVITSETGTISESAQIRRALEVFNADNNIYGNAVRIILGSETISQGYTLKAVRQTHVVQGHWNMASIDQSLGRVFRTGSHDQLPEAERYVNIYRHASLEGCKENSKKCVKLERGVSSPSGGTFSKFETIDVYVYSVAERKEYMTSQLYRLMKKAAWDCALAYKRNVLITDTNGSRECDYVECNYQCDSFDRSDIDRKSGDDFLVEGQGKVWSYDIVSKGDESTSNYNLLYSDKDVSDYTKNIIEIFHNYFALRYDMIVSLLPHENPVKFILIKSLASIINSRIPIRNRYGITSYLNESNNIYFLNTNVSEKFDYLSSVYTVFPLVTEKTSLEDVIESIQLDDDEFHIKNFVKNPIKESFDKFSGRTKIILLEASIAMKESENVVNAQKQYAINFVIDMLKDELYEMGDGNIVHNMYNSEYDGTGYDIAAKKLEKNGELRVFDKKKGTWSNVKKDDEEKYLSELKSYDGKKSKNTLTSNPYKIYGSLDAKNQFKIHDGRQAKARAGRVCIAGGCKITYLYEVFHHLGHLPYDDEVDQSIKGKGKKIILGLLRSIKSFESSPFANEVDDMSASDLEKLYAMFTMDKQELCNSIERFLKGENPGKLNLFIAG
jgi:hypothetical protein